jgi:hypothetical protein
MAGSFSGSYHIARIIKGFESCTTKYRFSPFCIRYPGFAHLIKSWKPGGFIPGNNQKQNRYCYRIKIRGVS